MEYVHCHYKQFNHSQKRIQVRTIYSPLDSAEFVDIRLSETATPFPMEGPDAPFPMEGPNAPFPMEGPDTFEGSEKSGETAG